MKNLGLGDLSVLAYGLNLAGYWPPCFKSQQGAFSLYITVMGSTIEKNSSALVSK